eukprot:CAMPEP_0113937648 /NCGR_PEP_ID=MMETSP1339-20121228/4225_1 /TAXON_ID=94617 /ORGANISM="Fibrocapsa japonica" /LENGTH=119 /DNA_ID=CAMNT_0000940493 /DNA_START=89 /DNA_END=448 /DNA_ORIENTATION=- /assembly_acc=CAM_ASM_000762
MSSEGELGRVDSFRSDRSSPMMSRRRSTRGSSFFSETMDPPAPLPLPTTTTTTTSSSTASPSSAQALQFCEGAIPYGHFELLSSMMVECEGDIEAVMSPTRTTVIRDLVGEMMESIQMR